MERDFLTIRQIVEIAKKSRMSHDTIREWKSIAKRRRWNELGENIHRIIDGQPAYHVSVLSGRMRKFVQISNPDAEAIKTRRDLDVRAARAKILSAIERRALETGRSWRGVALAFIAEIDRVASLPYSRLGGVISGFDLPYSVLREAKGWAGKGDGWRVSMKTLYRWRNGDANKLNASPAEKTGDEVHYLERGFRAAQKFIWTSPDATLEFLVASDEARFIEIIERRGYRVERVSS